MKLALFGYGGHAREVAAQIEEPVTFYVDDKYANDIAKPISKFNPKQELMLVAIGESNERKKVADKLPKQTNYFTFIHPTAQIMDSNIEIGEGSFIGANSILTTNIKLGKHALLNRGNHIGHDCVIGDYFSAMPGSIISGNVNIGNNVYIGSNSTVKEKLSICDNVIIGMSSCSVKSIIKSGIYVGTPCKRI
jgi:sugar O-acyltransferase (sialic acid O-acetyltransferase NeuD family)